MNSPLFPSRRAFLKTAGLGLAGWPLAGSVFCRPEVAAAQAVTTAPSVPKLLPLNRFPRMMQDWLIDRMDEWEGQGKMLRDAVTTKTAAEDYVKKVQGRIREAFGP